MKKFRTYKGLRIIFDERVGEGTVGLPGKDQVDPILFETYKGDPRIKGLSCAKASFIFASNKTSSKVLEDMIDEWFIGTY